jgi:hypothetical protein
MEQVGDNFEMVLVDDGSKDRTYKLLEEIAAVDSRVLVVKLHRSFGQTSRRSPPDSAVPPASSSWPWTASCSTTPTTFPPLSKSSMKGTT